MTELKPQIECPPNPIPPAECLAAEREVITATLEYADSLDLIPENTSFVRNSHSRLLRAQARMAEINIHNQLWRIGQAATQSLIATPSIIPPAGRRQ